MRVEFFTTRTAAFQLKNIIFADMKFSDIPAHDEVKQRLREMVNNDRIPHALILEGPAGIGKLSLARAMAQYLHCTNRTPEGDSCGVCASCRQHESLNHIDTVYVFPVVKTEKFRNEPPTSDDFMDQWREYIKGRTFMDYDAWAAGFGKKNAKPSNYVTESSALIHKLSLTSHATRYKVVLWWLPELMNEDTANKLLKLIEEPAKDSILIMVSDNSKSILPTIYSRLQRVEVRRYSDDVVAGYLSSTRGLAANDAMALAHISGGSISSAISNADGSEAEAQMLEMFIQLMRLAYQRNIAQLREWANTLAALTREQQCRFYEYCSRLMRENFVYNLNVPQLNYLNGAEQKFSANFARFITERNVEKLIEVFDKAGAHIYGYANGKIVNLDVAIKVILLLK